MSAPETSDLLTIDVSADDYAKIAATDQEVPPSDERKARTHQSEADFQAEKATYTAKIDNGDVSSSAPAFSYSSPTLANPCIKKKKRRKKKGPALYTGYNLKRRFYFGRGERSRCERAKGQVR